MPLEPFEWAPSTSTSDFASENISAQVLRQLCTSWAKKFDVAGGGGQISGKAPHVRPSNLAIWSVGLSCITLISLCAAVGVLFVRGLSKRTYNHFITVFVAVGVGSLISSSTLHLLPQGLGLADGEHYDFITVETFCILGIYTFFFCDKFIKISLESKKINDAEALDMTIARVGTETGAISIRSTDALIIPANSNGKAAITAAAAAAADGNVETVVNGQICGDDITIAKETLQDAFDDDGVDMSKQNPVRAARRSKRTVSIKSVADSAHGICVHDHEITFNEKKDSAIATVAWMIIFGDGLHNFIDGISIGAAFSESLLSGVSVSLAVLAEEFPHELGDVAILLNAGMNLKQTLFYNLMSTVTCFIGFVIGVLLGSIDSFLKCIFGFSGGMFLYIALSCMMPEMKRTMEEALAVSRRDAFLVLSLQTTGLTIGTLSMFFFARYGDLITFE